MRSLDVSRGLRTMDGEPAQEPAQAPARGWSGVVALAVVGATAVGWRWASRPPAVRTISMGPGGWVSFKNSKGKAPRTLPGRRPRWARLLRAQRLG